MKKKPDDYIFGRPKGSFKWGEPKTVAVNIKLTQTAHQFFIENGKGDIIEKLARDIKRPS